ncbi:hypothetical protein TEA_001480 [Camellia sinensis var. sinensis]|uniref:non-specific serine/threonine protein kinase n=1 Tax=Camellia sinensis var. sinensis TaxID=542762 RepID=A0A4S4E895_CAMSN|nr:hypothetical protein TEA_001480 [Camellia sinensis var. sinensis]
MVAQSSGVSRDDKMLEQGLQVQATEVHTSFEGIGPNPDLKEQGSDVSEAALDTGDLNSNAKRESERRRERGSPRRRLDRLKERLRAAIDVRGLRSTSEGFDRRQRAAIDVGGLRLRDSFDQLQRASTEREKVGEFKELELISLQDNNLTGEIPTQLGQLTSLMVLDPSQNALTGSIIGSLADATSLQVMLMDHNRLSGEIPASFSKVHNLIQLDLSFNNLLVVIVLFLPIGRGKLSRLTSLKKKVVVTFAYTPTELNYDNMVRATENFSVRNLIGTGGFGSTYKAELVPGFLVAVKRLSIEAEMFLIYNYLSGGNLETFIHERSDNNVEWLAQLLEVFETHATTVVASTFGYVALEYATTCRVSNKADVYSFGVVLSELMS